MKGEKDTGLVKIIADFIEQGLVENIVVMFKRDPSLYELTGELLRDERFMVRMGVAVLFEELVEIRPKDVALAIPSLLPLLEDETPFVRGEAVNILGIIGTSEALDQVRKLEADPDPQVVEIVADILSSIPSSPAAERVP